MESLIRKDQPSAGITLKNLGQSSKSIPPLRSVAKPEEQVTLDTTYPEAGVILGKLLDKKQEAYGDSFNKSEQILRILYPNGITLEQYKDMLVIVRDIDKLFRIATRKDAFGESPYKDKAGYNILAWVRDEKEKIRFITLDNSKKNN